MNVSVLEPASSKQAVHVPLPERLRAFREERSLSHADVAVAISATPGAVRRWELGTARPSREEAARLEGLGLVGIAVEDTNATSRVRLGGKSRRDLMGQARSNRRNGRRLLEFGDSQVQINFAPYVLNGPLDQTSFHEAMVQLQVKPEAKGESVGEAYLRRLSLVADVDGRPTSQSLLERPRETATSWNSNYGSHGWHRYVGRFPPHVVRALLNHFAASPEDLVLDPFAGSGTTNVECRLLGIPSVGVEISPLSALIARTKSKFPEDPLTILELKASLSSFYTKRWTAITEPSGGGVPGHDVVFRREGNTIPAFPNYAKWLTPEALLGVSIVAEYASKLEGTMRDLLLVALSSKMRSIGNVDVDVVRAEYRAEPRTDVNVLGLVNAQLRKMAASVDAIRQSHSSVGPERETRIIEGNILDLDFDRNSISHVITSPPYGIESLSYLRTHLLSFRCLEPFLKADPYRTGAGVIGSEYIDRPEAASADYEHASRSRTFARFFRQSLGEDNPNLEKRVPMMMRFFDDIAQVVARLGEWVRPSGGVAFVIGNKRLGANVVPAHQIMVELFAASGFELRKTLAHKLKTNNSNSQVPWQERIIQNEYVLILFRR
jgi:transcriptional regulator with XRE-family HTH domain